MMGQFRSVRSRVLKAIEENPSSSRLLTSYSPTPAKEFVPDAKYVEAMAPALRAALEASLKANSGLTGPVGTERLKALNLEPGDLTEPFSLGKAWHALHFILSGTQWEATEPPGDAVLGGKPVGDSLGYGPVRIMSPDQVVRTSNALSLLDAKAIRNRFNADALLSAEIYPGGWDSTDETADWIEESFVSLRDFYASAVACGDGLLMYLT
jgi:hypothetical protein